MGISQAGPHKVRWSTSLLADESAGDMSAAAINGEPTILKGLRNISYHFVWSGTPTGTISIQVSNNHDVVNETGDWETLAAALFVPAITQPAGAAGTCMVDLDGINAEAIRPVFTRAAGSGTLRCWIKAKE